MVGGGVATPDGTGDTVAWVGLLAVENVARTNETIASTVVMTLPDDRRYAAFRSLRVICMCMLHIRLDAVILLAATMQYSHRRRARNNERKQESEQERKAPSSRTPLIIERSPSLCRCFLPAFKQDYKQSEPDSKQAPPRGTISYFHYSHSTTRTTAKKETNNNN